MQSPPYLSELLTRLPSELSGDQLFLHLGHFCEGKSDMGRAQRQMNAEVLGRADLGPGLSVLDVGCGIGGTLAAVGDGLRRTGLDIGADQLAVAERSVPGVTWVHGDACEMPFDDESFDRILCIEAAFHFSSRRRFFLEAARVLKRNGRLVMSDIIIGTEAPNHIVELVTAGLAPWPDPLGTEGSLAQLAPEFELMVEDVTDSVAPSFADLMGPDAINQPWRCVGGADQGTAALGHLCSRSHLSIVYVTAQLKRL